MREQFDKKLVNKIKSSFKELEEEYKDTEWEKFSGLYFGKKAAPKLLWVKWVSGIAAAMILGISLYLIVKPVQEISNENLVTIAKEQPIGANEGINQTDQGSLSQSQSEIQTEEGDFVNAIEGKTNKKETITIPKSTKKNSIASPKNLAIFSEKEEKPTLADNQLPEKALGTVSSITDIPSKTNEEQMTQNEAIAQIKEWIGEKDIDSKENTIPNESFDKQPIKLGVMVAPQTISNSTQSLNLGAGLMSEISFSKKLKLDVGMAFARQNISPSSGGIIQEASLSNALDATSLKATAFTGNVINSSRELSFGQLDIPINLKYKVLTKKESDLYLISGISNMFYLNQQDVTTFNTANLAVGNFANSQQMVNTYSETVEPDPQSNGIDTGRMVNFGVGFEQNLKNGTFLSIEPFFKLPLGNQTFINQQFSMGGINLRMNFQLKTK